MSCRTKKPKGHVWEGNGPDRRCSSCGKKPKHISELYPKGVERFREMFKEQEIKLVRKHMRNR